VSSVERGNMDATSFGTHGGVCLSVSDSSCLILTLFLFSLPVLFLLFMWKKNRLLGTFATIAYVAVYAGFSVSGDYVLNNHGGADWRSEWCPKYLVYP
jgi:hypothetical protein